MKARVKKLCAVLMFLYQLNCVAQNAPLLNFSPPDLMADTAINKVNKAGKKEGLWREKSNNIITEGFFIDGVKQGTWKVYFSNGMVNTIEEYKNGKRHGLSIELKNTGILRKQCFYKNDVLDGWYVLYSNNGRIEMEQIFVNGKLDGFKKTYYPNGKNQEEGFYKNDKRHGAAKWFFEDGKISLEYNYVDGKLEGLQRSFHKNGNLNSETNYRDNLMNGKHIEYFEDGQKVKIKGEYLNDKKNGVWQEFDENEKLIKSERWKEDQLVK
jgi:antitoxin component YwqK of YwqJK toxin-antitoxin module